MSQRAVLLKIRLPCARYPTDDLRARVVSERIEGRIIGFVVTFDDMRLLIAQRKTAVNCSRIARKSKSADSHST